MDESNVLFFFFQHGDAGRRPDRAADEGDEPREQNCLILNRIS